MNPAGEQLLALARDVLAKRELQPDDDLFDSGLTSLLALKLVEGAAGFDLHFQLEDLLSTPTIAGLAELATPSTDAAAGPKGDAVWLQKGSSPRPVILLPPVGGRAWEYKSLVNAVDDQVSLVGFNCPDLHWQTGLLNMTEVMGCFLAEIRRLQPTGPYVLAGWSGGSYLAFELARRLAGQGDEIAGVVMLEPRIRRLGERIALSIFLNHAGPLMTNWPRLSRFLPVVKKILSNERRLFRFLATLDLDVHSLESLSSCAAVTDPNVDWARLSTIDEVTTRLIESIMETDREFLARYILVDQSPAEVLQNARVWKRNTRWAVAYVPEPSELPIPLTILVDHTNRTVGTWKTRTRGAIENHEFELLASEQLEAHGNMLEENNVAVYGPTLSETLLRYSEA